MKGITAATYVSFVNYIDSTGLARFGLHNGMLFDHTTAYKTSSSPPYLTL